MLCCCRQEWPLRPLNLQPKPCPARISFSGMLCQATTWLRVQGAPPGRAAPRGCLIMSLCAVGAPVREFVGWTFHVPLYTKVWAGASSQFFLDGPLVAICAVIFVPKLLCVVLAALWGRIFSLKRSKALPTEKTKTE